MNNIDYIKDLEYKNKYIKYNKNYLILKNQLYDREGGKPKLSQINIHNIMYIILDQLSYNNILEMISRNILSIREIDNILDSSALKISEGHTDITFLHAKHASKGSIMAHLERGAGISLGVAIPSYRINPENEPKLTSNPIIGHLEYKYEYYQIYKTKEFIGNIIKLINNHLEKRKSTTSATTDITKDFKSYEQMSLIHDNNLPFYGVIIFRASNSSCVFVEASKLTIIPQLPEENNTIVPTRLKINPIYTQDASTDGNVIQKYLTLVIDEYAYHNTNPFVSIQL